MIRSRLPCPVALSLLIACAGGVDEGTEDPEVVENRYVGGWDGSQTSGTTVLLLREGLSGTLSAASLGGQDEEYRVAFDIAGELDPETQDVTLDLTCNEVSARPMMPAHDRTMEEEPMWGALDCAGWELALECGLAGDCDGGDCNMICDITHFGDAYATAQLNLTAVEDELDFWERV